MVIEYVTILTKLNFSQLCEIYKDELSILTKWMLRLPPYVQGAVGENT